MNYLSILFLYKQIWLQPHIKFNNNNFSEIEAPTTTSQFQRYQCPVYSFLIKKGFNDEFSYPELYITTLELSVDNSITYWSEKNVCMVCEYIDEEEEFNILSLAEQNSNEEKPSANNNKDKKITVKQQQQ